MNDRSSLTDINPDPVDVPVKRTLVGMKMFKSTEAFEDWQRKAPREIYEVTPTPVVFDNEIVPVIYVTYNAGMIS